MSEKTRNLTKQGRRRFLRSLASLGVSGAALNYMSKETLADLTSDPKEEVPRLGALVHTNHEEVVAGEAPPEREPKYYTIPRDKWARVESAHDVAERLERRLDSVVDSDLVRFGVTQKVSGHHSRYTVVVRRDTLADIGAEPDISAAELEDLVPAKMTGQAGSGEHAEVVEDIPIEVEERTLELTNHNGDENWHYDYKYRSNGVPAGCMMTGINESDGSEAAGTSCTPAYDNENGGWVILTVAHMFGDAGEGNKSWQPYDAYGTTKFGNCEESIFRWEDKHSSDRDSDADRAFDWATVRPDSGIDTSYKFAADSGDDSYKNWEVNGIIGWDKIKDGYSLSKQGAKTKVQSGSVTVTFTNETFETDIHSEGGDSGGPLFKENYYEYPTSFKGIAGCTSYDAGGDTTGAIWSGKAESEFNIDI